MLADFLENQVKVQKEALIRSDLCMVALYSPNMGFSVGAEMIRTVDFRLEQE